MCVCHALTLILPQAQSITQPIDALLPFRLKRDDLEVGFFTTLTKFSAPGNVTLDELKIESYYPLDRETEEVCKRMMQP